MLFPQAFYFAIYLLQVMSLLQHFLHVFETFVSFSNVTAQPSTRADLHLFSFWKKILNLLSPKGKLNPLSQQERTKKSNK